MFLDYKLIKIRKPENYNSKRFRLPKDIVNVVEEISYETPVKQSYRCLKLFVFEFDFLLKN